MKKLSMMLAVAALVATGCDPYEDAPGGDPAILNVTAAGRLVEPLAATGDSASGWVLDDQQPLVDDADGDGKISDAEAAAADTEVEGKGVPAGAGGNNVIVVTTNRLLDGSTIQTAPQNPADASSIGDCRPIGDWLQIQKSVAGAAQAAEPLTTTPAPAACAAAPAPVPQQWYTCYYPGAATTGYGASIEIFRARANQAPGLTTATRPLTIARLQPDAVYAITGTVKDDSGRDLAINVKVETAPAAPSTNAFAASTTSATVEWEGVTGATSYDVYRMTPGETFQKIATVTTDTTYTDASRTAGEDYTYYVTTITPRGRSGHSAEVTATTAAPIAPEGVAATPIADDPCTPTLNEGSTGLVVTWAGSNAATYTVERADAVVTGTTTAPGPFAVVGTVNALTDGTEFEDTTGIAAETQYFYRVTAVNPVGSSPASAPGTGTTTAVAPKP